MLSVKEERYSRRDFLALSVRAAAGLGLSTLLSGCDLQNPPRETREIRKNVGLWTKEEVMVVARAMMADGRFEDIAHAGRLLLENQQGKPAISQESSLFSDERISIETVEALDYPDSSAPNPSPEFAGPSPMDAYIKQVLPIFEGTFKSRQGKRDLSIRTGTGLQLEKIRGSKRWMTGRPEFSFNLLLAKEIYNIRAFELMTAAAVKDLALDYDIPSDSLTQKALKTDAFTLKTADGIPVTAMADLLAHFFVLPDYNLAKDLGVLGNKSNHSWVLDTATELLKKQGVLYKDSDGKYKWRGEGESLNRILIKTAWAGAKIMFKPQSRT